MWNDWLKWLFKYNENDLGTLITVPIVVIGFSLFAAAGDFRLDTGTPFWLLPATLLLIVFYRGLEDLVRHFLGSWNRKVKMAYSVLYYALTIAGIAAIQSYI